MALYTASRLEVLDELVGEVLRHYGRGRTIVAVDGRDGAGKTRFAADLTERFRKAGHDAYHASIDDFHRPRELRYAKGKDSPTGFYEDSFDYDLFRRVLIEPFRMGGSAGFQLQGFDLLADRPVESRWVTGPEDAVLVVDGIFLHRPELRGLWHYSIWLEVDEAVAYARMAERDGIDPDPEAESNARYTKGQALYLRRADPRRRATATVDNTVFETPRRIFSDSC